MSINSELQLFRCISGTDLDGKIERSVYNKRKRKLFSYIEKFNIRQTLSNKFADFTDNLLSIQHQLKYAKSVEPIALQSAQRMKLNFFFTLCSTKSRYFVINYAVLTRMESFILSIFRLQMSMMLITLMMLRKIFRIAC